MINKKNNYNELKDFNSSLSIKIRAGIAVVLFILIAVGLIFYVCMPFLGTFFYFKVFFAVLTGMIILDLLSYVVYPQSFSKKRMGFQILHFIIILVFINFILFLILKQERVIDIQKNQIFSMSSINQSMNVTHQPKILSIKLIDFYTEKIQSPVRYRKTKIYHVSDLELYTVEGRKKITIETDKPFKYGNLRFFQNGGFVRINIFDYVYQNRTNSLDQSMMNSFNKGFWLIPEIHHIYVDDTGARRIQIRRKDLFDSVMVFEWKKLYGYQEDQVIEDSGFAVPFSKINRLGSKKIKKDTIRLYEKYGFKIYREEHLNINQIKIQKSPLKTILLVSFIIYIFILWLAFYHLNILSIHRHLVLKENEDEDEQGLL